MGSRNPPLSHEKKANDERVLQELVVAKRPELLRAACSGNSDWLKNFLKKEDRGAAVAREREVAIHLETPRRSTSQVPPRAATKGASALHVVAAGGDQSGYLEMAKVISSKYKELLVSCNEDGDTPLHCAARAGNVAMVSLLIELATGGDERKTMLRMQNKRGETALHEAVRFGDSTGICMVKALMSEDKELARVVANDGTSPLYLATSLHHRSIATELIAQDKKLAYSGPHGQNALHTAVLHSKNMTKELLRWNKDLTKELDISGSTPMHFAASADDPSLDFFLFVFMARTLEFYSYGIYFGPAKCLVKFYGWLMLPLYQLVQSDPSSAFQPDIDGLFPLHVAASAGNLVAVIILLTECAGCAGLLDSQGRTFLHTAVEKKRSTIVKFVCMRPDFKSILNVQDNQGNTALHLAVLGGDLCIFQALMKNRYVRLNLPNEEGNTPMDLSESKAPSGFYFGMHAQRRILGTLTFANAQNGNCRRDRFKEKLVLKLDKDGESKKITEFAQIVGICSVLVATATFAAVFTMPGGFRSDESRGNLKLAGAPMPGGPELTGTPIMAGKYAFDGFVIANTIAFSCSTIATFSLVYCGTAAVDIEKRIKLVSFSLALLNGSARSFCAAFAFALYLLLSPVARATAIATCAMTALVLLDALRFLWLLFVDAAIVLNRKVGAAPLLKFGTAFIVNMVYLFWPYIVLFGLLGNHGNSIARPLTHLLGYV
ncbi:ankyrin repeat-containing protein At5g02620-like [Phragmites australis]|uniref:ankyrin repeat-containing protein At5g02620-like n=1 Tax=Phragmites australis TaxID=29695 RepID=UPI002D776370|nr:ankyrin repeat-containing protein At5g02620-like [Phragmites australis]